MSSRLRTLALPALALACTLGPQAHASGLNWSIGVHSGYHHPNVSLHVGNGYPPRYRDRHYRHRHYAPRPVYVAPQPVYVAPPPVYVPVQPVYTAPQPVVVMPPAYPAYPAPRYPHW